jgi:hypothetical protein
MTDVAGITMDGAVGSTVRGAPPITAVGWGCRIIATLEDVLTVRRADAAGLKRKLSKTA